MRNYFKFWVIKIKVEAILKEHQNILNNLTGNKTEKIGELIDKFNVEKLFKFCEFILDMRNQSPIPNPHIMICCFII